MEQLIMKNIYNYILNATLHKRVTSLSRIEYALQVKFNSGSIYLKECEVSVKWKAVLRISENEITYNEEILQ
jgi:hypothetical protein